MAPGQLRKTKQGWEEFVKGYRPITTARNGLMLGIRNPVDGPVFQERDDATAWCISVMSSHFHRNLGVSEARIEAFEGWCCTLPPRHSTKKMGV
jgi:hypothetical protein